MADFVGRGWGGSPHPQRPRPRVPASTIAPAAVLFTVPMEVYLQNLPSDLTDQGLKDQISRFTKALSIQDWSCQKPRKKTFGFLTFLNPRDGEHFLKQH